MWQTFVLDTLKHILKYIKSKETRITKNWEFKKGVGIYIEIKSKETRSKKKARKQGALFRLATVYKNSIPTFGRV